MRWTTLEGLRVFCTARLAAQRTPKPAPTLDKWYYVTYVNEGTGNDLVMFVDGVEGARTVGGGGVMTAAAADLYLGNQPSLASGFQGVLDTVRFYSRALSADEIIRDYNAGSAHS